MNSLSGSLPVTLKSDLNFFLQFTGSSYQVSRCLFDKMFALLGGDSDGLEGSNRGSCNDARIITLD